jgi:uncharacterized phage infection (PIP) family protein YhgE
MARPTRSSSTLTNAERRESGLRSISDKLDLGNNLRLTTYSDQISTLRQKLSLYNTTLASLDDIARELKDMEKQMRILSEQMLLGVAAKYGKDSREYGKAGGIPKSERKKPTKKLQTQKPPIAPEESPLPEATE